MIKIQKFSEYFEGYCGRIETLVDVPEKSHGVAIVTHPHPLYGGYNQNKVTATIARTLNQEGYVTFRPNFRGVGHSHGKYNEGVGEAEDMIWLLDQIHAIFTGYTDLVLAGFSFGAFVITRVLHKLLEDIPLDLHQISPINLYVGKPSASYSEDKYKKTDEFNQLAQQANFAAQENDSFSSENDNNPGLVKIIDPTIRQLQLKHVILAGLAAGKFDPPQVSVPALIMHGENDDVIPLNDVMVWAQPQSRPVTVIPGADHYFAGKLHILRQIIAQQRF